MYSRTTILAAQTKELLHLFGVSMYVNKYLVDPESGTNSQPNIEERNTSNRKKALRGVLSKRPQSCSMTCGKQKGFHKAVRDAAENTIKSRSLLRRGKKTNDSRLFHHYR